MNISKEEKKLKAIKTLKELNIYKPYIDGFKKNDYVCYFNGYAGFWTYQDKELTEKIKEIETKVEDSSSVEEALNIGVK